MMKKKLILLTITLTFITGSIQEEEEEEEEKKNDEYQYHGDNLTEEEKKLEEKGLEVNSELLEEGEHDDYLHRRVLLSIENNTKEFSCKLNRILYSNFQQHGNVLFQPYIIITSLSSMAMAAVDEAYSEITNALGFYEKNFPQEKVHDTFGYIMERIIYSGQTQIKLINGIFITEEGMVKADYMIEMREHYRTRPYRLPIYRLTEHCTAVINEYVSNRTQRTIPKLISKTLDRNDEIILTPIMYYNALWLREFNESDTKDEIFYTNTGKTTVKMMSNKQFEGYINLPSIKAEGLYIRMYGYDTSFNIILPYENQTLENVIQLITNETLTIMGDEIELTTIKYKIPRMNLTWADDLIKPMRSFGINRVFNLNRKLTNMVYNMPTKITKIPHHVFFMVNEKGAGSCKPMKIDPLAKFIEPDETASVEITVNRPFLFYIRRIGTNSILVMGCVNNPNGN